MIIGGLKCRTFALKFDCVILDAKFEAETTIENEHYD